MMSNSCGQLMSRRRALFCTQNIHSILQSFQGPDQQVNDHVKQLKQNELIRLSRECAGA